MSKHAQDTGSRLDTGAAALWASAFVIAAMIVSQASRLGAGNPAYAGNVSEVGDLTVMTASAGDNEDVLAVLDRRDEILYIYGVEQGRDLTLFQIHRVDELFQEAKGSTRRK
ncbi:MAG: hypothetical protein R3B46_08600 [Phycisphaerales bacterium]|nr:hypothetical protein [Phycisphaerales bacterium]